MTTDFWLLPPAPFLCKRFNYSTSLYLFLHPTIAAFLSSICAKFSERALTLLSHCPICLPSTTTQKKSIPQFLPNWMMMKEIRRIVVLFQKNRTYPAKELSNANNNLFQLLDFLPFEISVEIPFRQHKVVVFFKGSASELF